MSAIEPTQKQIEAAARVMAEHGIEFCLPWECSLDDLDLDRYEALRKAIKAALEVAEEP